MHYIQLAPQQAAVIAVFAGVGFVALTARRHERVPGGARLALREVAIAMALLALWGVVGIVAIRHVAGATAHGDWVWAAERTAHLPSEAAVQAPLLAHVTLTQAANFYYLYGHLNVIAALLIWLFWRHRDDYAWVRATLVLFTLASTLLQSLPVAPPRLLPGLGVVDTPALYDQSVYSPLGTGSADQLAAMPSIHVGWAILAAVVVLQVSTSRWRWLVLLHPVLMSLVVVDTGNHFWADGIVAGVLLVPALAVGPACVAWAAARRRSAAEPALVPEPAMATSSRA